MTAERKAKLKEILMDLLRFLCICAAFLRGCRVFFMQNTILYHSISNALWANAIGERKVKGRLRDEVQLRRELSAS